MFIHLDVDEIIPVSTSHAVGLKKILAQGSDQPVKLKQVAFGKLLPGQNVPIHVHPDMDEVYFFQNGYGIAKVDDVVYDLKPGIFVYIPAGSKHDISCSTTPLEFFYFGLENINEANTLLHP
ncbi:hypothetical protein ADIARSV_1747 [Arcticibacter svalbardensis MN12-7]|uniref:Cupin type-2 domain-containing protein n=1 Tax=Arcticibacter svalbardensis MN12-7 TaxID=1150600 RepID=R9GT66_9SPHI|nr:cupin domain-containing protein [Arcticibacter svalbardensis]EOR95047.1 hypothetical protein ADIARSV_1747 [Arcticibacter svalbardensis MN12-7]